MNPAEPDSATDVGGHSCPPFFFCARPSQSGNLVLFRKSGQVTAKISAKARHGRLREPHFVMPYRFEFDVEHKILLILPEGEIGERDVATFNDEIRRHVRELNPSGAIIDCSAVTSFNPSGEALRQAAMPPAPFPAETPRFIVAPTDYLFGMSRMYQLAANRPREMLKVVRTMQEALAGLGVQNPQFTHLP